MNLKRLRTLGKAAAPLFAACLLLTAPAPATAASQDMAQKMVDDAIAAETSAQKQQTRWNAQRAAMLEEIRQLKSENLWLSFQEKKYSRYVGSIEGKIAELQRIKAELERMEQELEPLLYSLVDRLTDAVQTDLPFLKQERTRRLDFLQRTLDDHELSNGEKLRRILEALEVETAYGRSAEMSEQTIQLDGKPTQARVFRAGRLGLYCLTPDQATAGRYERKAAGFVTMDSEFVRPLTELQTMIERKRYTNFIYLPVKEVR
ncbi:DUF3450 domain-containing protein [Salidesulfovibrio onnuriiensis]|uniref:DUF3450 domain-containing protein n=1 Tax=Salidesulfovibrio onnuriiensis TaxID=2583823 RepID=UPI0011C7B747|nr:DUF3450 domain-containing protein [Salidesulfovibrio onnuriiensis]